MEQQTREIIFSEGSMSQSPATPTDSCSEVPISIDESTNDVSLTLGPTDRHRSSVWIDFTRKEVGGKTKCECKHCKKLLVGGAKAGTSHLREHAKKCPMKKSRDLRQSLLNATRSKVGEAKSLENWEFVQEAGRKDLATMVILHEYPLSIVDHYGFKKYSNTLQPMFKMISRNTLKKDVLKIYDAEREKTMQLLEKTKSRVSITTDLWSSDAQRKGYMAITAHFIDNSWNLQSRIIRFLYVPYPHTKEVLADCLMECFFDWNLDRKLMTLTVDNCTTNDALVPLLLDKLPFGSLILHGQFFHMRCCAHILNLIVQDGLAVIGDGIERIRDSVVYWKGSDKRLQRFEESARQLHIASTKKLVLDCKTRWNSTFEMLQTALIYKEVFGRMSFREPQYKSLPTDEDWEIGRDICDRLELFSKATELFSRTKYPTANSYFPTICGLRLEISKWLQSPNPVIRNMAFNMLEKFNKYWSIINGIMGVATLLDPRYKMGMLEYYYKKIYGEEETVNELMRIKNLCFELMSEYEGKQGSNNDDQHHPPQPSLGGTSKCPLIDDLSDFDKFIQTKDTVKTCGRSELDRYLEDGMMPRTQDFDILTFWKSSGPKYPLLQRIARDIFAIPVSSVASESAFSTGGRVISPHRSRLLPTTVEAFMCSQSWLWNEIRGSSSLTDPDCFIVLNDMDVDEEVSV